MRWYGLLLVVLVMIGLVYRLLAWCVRAEELRAMHEKHRFDRDWGSPLENDGWETAKPSTHKPPTHV